MHIKKMSKDVGIEVPKSKQARCRDRVNTKVKHPSYIFFTCHGNCSCSTAIVLYCLSMSFKQVYTSPYVRNCIVYGDLDAISTSVRCGLYKVCLGNYGSWDYNKSQPSSQCYMYLQEGQQCTAGIPSIPLGFVIDLRAVALEVAPIDVLSYHHIHSVLWTYCDNTDNRTY